MKRKETSKVRPWTTGIALILIVSMLPLAALAAAPSHYVNHFIYDNGKAKFDDYGSVIAVAPPEEHASDKAHTVKASDYEQIVLWEDHYYELTGIGSPNKEKTELVTNGVKEVKVPAFPTKAAGTSEEDYQKAVQKWVDDYAQLIVAYSPHGHDTSDCPWIASPTNHWKICRKCRKDCEMSWHWDNDKDGLCDLCGYKVPYHPIDVKASAGGTIQVSKDRALLGDVIQVTAVPDAGYHLKEVHFYNLNELHSELTRYEDKKGEAYHFQVLPWDVEIESVFEKD